MRSSDDDEEVFVTLVDPLQHGMATPAGDGDDDEPPAATFWLPDPTTHSGWSMRHVWRKDPPSPKPFGFRRRQ